MSTLAPSPTDTAAAQTASDAEVALWYYATRIVPDLLRLGLQDSILHGKNGFIFALMQRKDLMEQARAMYNESDDH